MKEIRVYETVSLWYDGELARCHHDMILGLDKLREMAETVFRAHDWKGEITVMYNDTIVDTISTIRDYELVKVMALLTLQDLKEHGEMYI